MKDKLIQAIGYHIITISIAFCITYVGLYFYNNSLNIKENSTVKIIRGNQTIEKRLIGNWEISRDPIELVGSLSNDKYLTMMGSSELGNASPYQPYNFLPDSLNFPVAAFGHAHHQSFAILCELLAMQKHLKQSKICIILSPGWFEKEGTNIEAFIEFIRPDFLKSIIHNEKIDMKYKLEIGRYINENYDLIENPTPEFSFFQNLNQNYFYLSDIKKRLLLSKISNVEYRVKHAVKPEKEVKDVKWKQSRKNLQMAFLKSIKSNKFYIQDSYYTEFLLHDGKYKRGNTDDLDVTSNRELEDVKLLIGFLKSQNCAASFLISPLNPYHYKDLKNFDPIVAEILKETKKNNFPCLNLFDKDPKKFEPGTLLDIMHLNDYGWMKVNEFLYTTYKKKK